MNRPSQVAATLLTLLLVVFCALRSPRAHSASNTILITAVYYDAYLSGEPDEAFRLMNVSGSAVDLTGWTVTDAEGTVTLSATLDSGQSIWVTREAISFAQEFGFDPDYEYGVDTDPAVPNLVHSGSFQLANNGDQVILKKSGGTIVDSVVYEGADPTDEGWSGPPIEPYGGTSVGVERFSILGPDEAEGFDIEGQILYRKLDQTTGLPVADSDSPADWAQDTYDGILQSEPVGGIADQQKWICQQIEEAGGEVSFWILFAL